jgi:aminopeptidase
MQTFEQKLERYAELAVHVGVNVQDKQTLVILAPIETAPFVRLLTKAAYKAGAKHVYFDWSDGELTRIKYQMAPEEAFSEFPMWKARGFEEMAKDNAAFLYIDAEDPDLLKGIDPNRIATANKTSKIAMQAYRNYTLSGTVSWSIVSVPTRAWAQKVFPDLEEQAAISRLWELIFKVTRADQPDPVQAWQEHLQQLEKRREYLNNMRFKALHYKAPGTDLSVELPEKHLWLGGGLRNGQGTLFVPNLPTEEVFTLPKKDGVNGVVTSTKPLSYNGTLIENFSFTFENGKIVKFTAEKGYETLKKLLETDAGSQYLGEVALVPHNSPISESNVIFFSTLFDENASSHLAIGAAYPTTLQGGTRMTQEELQQNGANSSLSHVDFMIGSAEMDIDAETHDGTRIPLMRNGSWAI